MLYLSIPHHPLSVGPSSQNWSGVEPYDTFVTVLVTFSYVYCMYGILFYEPGHVVTITLFKGLLQ
jgi:hypothetical protein